MSYINQRLGELKQGLWEGGPPFNCQNDARKTKLLSIIEEKLIIKLS